MLNVNTLKLVSIKLTQEMSLEKYMTKMTIKITAKWLSFSRMIEITTELSIILKLKSSPCISMRAKRNVYKIRCNQMIWYGRRLGCTIPGSIIRPALSPCIHSSILELSFFRYLKCNIKLPGRQCLHYACKVAVVMTLDRSETLDTSLDSFLAFFHSQSYNKKDLKRTKKDRFNAQFKVVILSVAYIWLPYRVLLAISVTLQRLDFFLRKVQNFYIQHKRKTTWAWNVIYLHWYLILSALGGVKKNKMSNLN